MKTNASLAVAVLTAASLAACGGGGSSSTIPTGGGGGTPPASHAKLNAGFASSRGAASSQRSAKALASSLQPIADLVIADSYVTYKPYAPISVQAVAYYDPASGTVPNPLPTGVTWAASGAAGATFSQQTTGQNLLGEVDSIGEALVTATGTFGAGSLTATASNGDVVTLVFNVYPGTALDAETAYTGTKPCVTFTANGATPGATGDLCLKVNADHTTSYTAPLGLVLVQKQIDAVTSTDTAAISSTATSIASTTVLAGGGLWTIAAKTALGGTVTFMPWPINSGGGADPVTAGQPIYAFGQYHVGV